LVRSGLSGQIQPDWSPEFELTGFWQRWPDFGNINRMLSDSNTGNISMVVGCLNVKVDCVV
jgi:hypothetical protein